MKMEVKEQVARDPSKKVIQIKKDYLTHISITDENEEPPWEDVIDIADPLVTESIENNRCIDHKVRV